MTASRLLTSLIYTIFVAFSTASRVVNISDAWLLSDSESPVFYRHFRDRVTWSEAEAICQFHHSVLATVRNTGEFDRTRALLQELAWTTPVWVGLRRVLGQPMFKWSTPPGATLLPSDGYWHEAPGPMLGTRALCVTVDPAADYRWRAVDCANSAELFSFLCQIPVPTWARSEHGGCLSPRWPSAEVTVQYLPQTRALEMTADCGLKGTKRIACKQHSTVAIEHMESKLQCPSDTETSSVTGSVTPPRPPTRHRRDTKASTLPTPHSDSTDVPAIKETVVSGVTVTSTSIAPEPTTPRPMIQEVSSSALVQMTPLAVTELPNVSHSILSTSTSPPFTHLLSESSSMTVLMEVTTEPEKITSVTQDNTSTDETTAIDTTTSDISTMVSEPMTTETTVTTPEHSLSSTPQASTPKLASSTNPHIAPPLAPVVQSSVHHQVASGTPRNVAALTHVSNHPPMVIAVSAAGLPRNVLSSQHPHAPLPPPLLHPVKAEGTPRIADNAEIHRSAEDHVTSWRRQFLPTSLRGISTPPVAHHPPQSVVAAQEEEGEETTVAASNPLNSQTEEEIMEAARRRQHSRRSNRPQQSSHQTRNLYPYLINRMLG